MAGRYQAYPEYKDSGVEWLGEIPKHWAIAALKMLIDVRDGTHDTPAYVEADDGSFPLVTSKDVTSGVLSFELCKHISAEDYQTIIRRSKVDIGDIIMPMIGTVGSPIVIYERDDFAIKNLALFKTSKSKNIDTSFLNYFLQSSECEIQFSLEARGGVQNFVSLGVLRDLGIPKNPKEEQIKIANFLDHETAKIDLLIEKQQQLIQLLKEKRQAVISHAVTKGLNPDVPMRDSGVEWLGEVPQHWELPKLIHVTTNIGDGLHSTPEYQDNTGYFFINGNNLVDGSIVISSSAKEVPEEEYRKHYIHLDSNSVLLSINGTIGNVARYNGERIILGKSAAYINTTSYLLPDYLIFYLQSNQIKHYFDLEVTGTTIFNLSLNSLRQMRVCIPSRNEQIEIEKYCFNQNIKYNLLIEKANSAIALMQERRTALISAAVTGKIDVRNWQPPETHSTEAA